MGALVLTGGSVVGAPVLMCGSVVGAPLLVGGSVRGVSLLTGGSFMGGLAGGMSVVLKGEIYPFVGGVRVFIISRRGIFIMLMIQFQSCHVVHLCQDLVAVIHIAQLECSLANDLMNSV